MSQPNYNDTDWITVHPGLQYDIDSVDFKGIAWLRLHVWADSTIAGTPLAILMTHSGASEIYLDGELKMKYGTINGPDNTVNYDPNRIPFVITMDTVGEHILAIRYANYDAKTNYVKYQFPLAGFTFRASIANNLLDKEFKRRAIVGFISIFVTGLCIALSLLHFFLYIYYKAEKSNMFFSLFCISMATAFLLPYIASYHSYPVLTMQLRTWTLVALSVLLFALSGLSNDLFIKSKLRFYIITFLCVMLVIVGYFHFLAGTVFFVILLGITTLEAFILTIIAIIRKVQGARIIGIGILLFTMFFLYIFIITAVNGGLRYDDGTEQGQIMLIMAIIAILSIPISMSVHLAWKFANINRSLNDQLIQVKELSEKTILQEQEKKQILETQKEKLEEEVKERTSEIVAEKQKSDDLLHNILPEEIADELKERGATTAHQFDHVTVLFTDFVDFTIAGERMGSQALVEELHNCFKAFDEIMSKYGIEKIKTIGDAYMAVCGLPTANEHHAEKVVLAAQDIRSFMIQRREQLGDKTFDIRIGIHSGEVVAGIVGVKKFAYDIWGDTVNTAARMESNSEPGKINISQTTYELIRDMFTCTYRGELEAKGKGKLKMYFVEA